MNRPRAVLPILALAATIAVVACGGKKAPQTAPSRSSPSSNTAAPPPPPPPPPPPSQRTAGGVTGGGSSAALSEDEVFARKSLDQLNNEKPLEDVFFDLDKSEIRTEDRAALQKGSDWLKRWGSTRLTIEGHCDSRGSAEYNLALGSRRATTVRDYLVSLGVPVGRLTVVSKGKEQPFCKEENESCWQENRRGHFVITGK